MEKIIECLFLFNPQQPQRRKTEIGHTLLRRELILVELLKKISRTGTAILPATTEFDYDDLWRLDNGTYASTAGKVVASASLTSAAHGAAGSMLLAPSTFSHCN